MKKNLFTLMMVLFVLRLFAETNIYAPTLTAPANGAVNQTPDVFLNWAAVPGAWTYKVQISTDSNFTNPLKYSCYATAMHASELLFGTQYWWRVKAIGISDSSVWSAVWKFTVIGTITITSPPDSSTERLVRMPFSWSHISGVAFFDWEADSSLAFNSPMYRTGSTVGTIFSDFTKQLYFGQVYYLRMRARHSLDTSNWCTPIMFKTLNIFKLRRPNNNYDTLQMPNVTAKWDWAGASYYDVAFAFDSSLTSPKTVSVDSSSITYNTGDTAVFAVAPTLRFDTIYYWSVRARNVYDTSSWVPSRSFRTVKQVTLSSPAMSDSNVTTLTKFQWLAITGIKHYVLQYDSIAFFPNPAQKIISGDTLTFTATHQLKDHKTYYWRMKAVSTVDSTIWSAVWNFRTGGGVGIESISLNNDNVTMYPNPSHGKLTVEIESTYSGSISLTLLNILGQTVMTKQLAVNPGKSIILLNLDDLTNGIFLLQLQNKNNTITRKIILDK